MDVTGLQATAAAIFDERRRLNTAFERIKETVSLLCPECELRDDGSIYNTATKEITSFHGALYPVEVERGVEAPPEGGRGRKERLEDLLLERGKPTAFAYIKNALTPRYSENDLRQALADLALEGKVKESQGGWLHSTAAPPTKPPIEPVPLEPPRPTEPPTTAEAPAPPVEPIPSVSESKEDRRAATGDDRGLARSPRPRSEMRIQQAAAEARLDDIVQWVIDQSAKGSEDIDPITFTKFVLKTESNAARAMVSKDFRTLAERGVLKQVGEFHPTWKARTASMGRGTKRYRLVREEAVPPKAEPAPTLTKEAVRDGAVEMREFAMEELVTKLHKRGYDVERDKQVVVDAMSELIRKKAFEYTAHSTYKYVPPPQTPTQRPSSVPSHRTEGATPVAGTGRKDRFQKQYQGIIDKIKGQGAQVDTSGSGHIRVTYEGKTITMSSTPNARATLKVRADLRRIGLAV